MAAGQSLPFPRGSPNLPDVLREELRTSGHHGLPQHPATARDCSGARLWVLEPEHMCGMLQSSHRTALRAEICPIPSFHLCLGAERSWVKIWKALTRNRARVEILVASLRFSARTKHVPHHSLPQVSTDQTLLRHSALQ